MGELIYCDKCGWFNPTACKSNSCTPETNSPVERDPNEKQFNRGDGNQGKCDSGWISVDDRLPETNQDVLSVDKIGRVYNSTWMGKYFKCVGLVWEHSNVTHWMPLPCPPEPPKADK